MEEQDEGALIDGYLRYILNLGSDGVQSYLSYILYKDQPENRLLELKQADMIESRLKQYSLASEKDKGHKIEGDGLDALKAGGYATWRALKMEQEQRKERRENGMYQINKYLFYTSIIGLIFTIFFSLYQSYTNTQTNAEIELLKQRLGKIESPAKNQKPPK